MAKARGTFVVPRGFDPEAKRFATIVNDSIAQIKGEKGDPLDAAVTFRDLVDTGIAKRNVRINSDGRITGTNSNQIVIGDEEVFDTPPPPTGVSASGAFQNVIISFNVATFANFSHAEVFAASSNSFASRVFIGQTTAGVFSHSIGTGQTRYYWVRFVNTQNTAGPFNSTTGTVASTALIDTQHIADSLITAAKLVDGAVSEVKVATNAITETKISNNAITTDKLAANSVVADKIAANQITAAKMVAGTITAASGIIGNLAIDSAQIIDGAIVNAKIGNLAVDDAKIANLNATKITAGQIDTARINVSGLITAGSLITGTNLSTNGQTSIHGGNILTNTIQATSLTITPLETGQAAADINSNTTLIDGGKITTNSIAANRIITTDLVLPSSGGLVSGSTIGNFNSNSKRYAEITTVGTGAGLYQGYVRLVGGNGQVKTIHLLFSDGTVNTTVTSGGTDTAELLDGSAGVVYRTPDIQHLNTSITNSRLISSADTANIPIVFRYTGSGTVKCYIYGQGDSNARQIGSADVRFVKFSAS